jgi:hypothetical protein
MMERFRAWCEETRGASFELVRHFLARVFDSEMVTTSGGWQKVAIGLFAVLLSVSFLGLRLYYRRYNNVESPAFLSAKVYSEWIRADMLLFIAVAMAVTALLTLLAWQSLFPSVRDCLALAGLPVSARQIFRAKFTALLLLFTTFVLAMTVPPALSFAIVTAGQWQENPSGLANVAANFSAIAGGASSYSSACWHCGILLNVLPAVPSRDFPDRAGPLFIATLGALPLVGRQPAAAALWPPVWFLRCGNPSSQDAGRAPAVLAIALCPLFCVWSTLSAITASACCSSTGGSRRAADRRGSWFTERWIRDPREQAAFVFIAKTLARSGCHRLILLAYAGIALGWITNGVLDAGGRRSAMRACTAS